MTQKNHSRLTNHQTNDLLFCSLNIFRSYIFFQRPKVWHLNHPNPMKTRRDIPKRRQRKKRNLVFMRSRIWEILLDQFRKKIGKVCSINVEPPENDLCSACHVYPLSRGAWIISILFILNRFTWGLNYIIWWISQTLWPSELKHFSYHCQWTPS